MPLKITMTTLYLTRHGETEENAKRILQGLLQTKLTPRGIEQANALKEKLKDIHFDAILCSDLVRAMDTASILASPHYQEPVQNPLLRERDWGSWTGAYIPEIRGKDFPADVESVEHMFKRAHTFLKYITDHYPNQTILAVGHGLMDRVIEATIKGKTIQEVPVFTNAEVRIYELSGNLVDSENQTGDIIADN